METAGKVKEKVFNVTIVLGLLFVFSGSAHAGITVTPTSIKFPGQAVGTVSASTQVTITNNAKNGVKFVKGSVSASQFAFTGPSFPITLNRGQSATWYVTFDPSAAQAYAGTLLFARTNSSTISVGLSGTGVQTTSLSLSRLPPSITSQPASAGVNAGQAATFSVAATGTTPMSYQWSKNGAAISGATSSSYTTPATTTSDNGEQFIVVLSNGAGTAKSNAATLTVNAATLLLNSSATSLSFGSTTVSVTSAQSVTLANTGSSVVTISNVSVSGAGFYATGVSTGTVLNPGQTATLTASFTPATTGSVTGSVTVSSNASNSPDKIGLSGTGVIHSVSLSWSPSVSTVIGYNSYSSKTSGGPYTKLTSTPVLATAYTDSGVQAGQTLYYVVTSVDSNSVESSYSAEVSATVP